MDVRELDDYMIVFEEYEKNFENGGNPKQIGNGDRKK